MPKKRADNAVAAPPEGAEPQPTPQKNKGTNKGTTAPTSAKRAKKAAAEATTTSPRPSQGRAKRNRPAPEAPRPESESVQEAAPAADAAPAPVEPAPSEPVKRARKTGGRTAGKARAEAAPTPEVTTEAAAAPVESVEATPAPAADVTPAPKRPSSRRTAKAAPTKAAPVAETAPEPMPDLPDVAPPDERAEVRAGADTESAPAIVEVAPPDAPTDAPEAAPEITEVAAPLEGREAAEVSAKAGVAVRPKRPRKGARRTPDVPAEEPARLPDVTELAEPVELAPVVETAPEPAPIEPVAAEPAPEAAAPKKGRRPKKGGVAPTAEAAPEPALPEPALEATPEPVVDEAPALQPASRKGGRGKRAARTAQPAPVAEATAPEPAAEPEAEDATPAPARSGAARDLLMAAFAKLGRPVHVRDLERQFTRRDRETLGDRNDIERAIEALVASGDLIRTRKRTYGLPEAMNLVRGRFQASAGGFGFVIPEAGGDDYYIPPEATLEAWNGDTVLVRAEGGREGRRGDSPRGAVVRIVARAHKQLVGTLEHAKGYAILKADDSRARHRILLMPEEAQGVPAGARVLAELFWPEDTGEDEVFGRITRVLGEADDPETETQAVIVKFGLRDEFPAEALAEAEAIPTTVQDEALVGRLDLRDYNIFTVDGRDAKDFDDAIHIQPAPGGGFVVGVHIADVSHYVRAGSALDQEAQARATSTYLPGHVLPMLPERLSNGVCSLVPYEDRLTLSAMIEVNADGDVLRVQLAPSVIRSQARLTYDEVQAYSEGNATLPDHARKIEGDLHLLLKLTTRMRQKRLRDGSLDFKLREVKVDVDKDGNLQLIPLREETARGMIEDLMLLANKVVARHMLEHNAPALYRVHEEPTQGRFGEVSAALARMGLTLGTEPTPQAYQAALKKVRGTPQETVVNTLLLRSLKQARYTGENLGHFGLAFEEYLHFTSPIRRYPDLVVHRALRASLAHDLGSREMQDLRADLTRLGDHSSERERAAAEAERDLTKYYQAKWAQAHLGETFEGNVTGVTSFGLFVGLDNGVEGLLHISNLDDDYYFFLEDALMLRGRSSGRTYRLGDPVLVTIAQVNPIGRSIDFTQETDMSDSTKPRARKRGEREQERAAEREPRMNERPPRLAALDAQQQAEAVNRRRDDAPRGPGGPGGPGGQGGRTRNGGRPATGDRFAPAPRAASGGRTRRVITLDRPRNEHNRPVNVTVQRMYFGDWSLDNLREDEPQGGGGGGGRPRGGGRSAAPAVAAPVRPAAPAEAQNGADGNRRRRRRRGRGKSNGSGGE